MSSPIPNRAPRMSVEDRRESILDAVVPLLLSQGADVTTKDIADAAGIAEGTIFRAFVDKEELIQQAVARFMDPEPTRLRRNSYAVFCLKKNKRTATSRIRLGWVAR